MVFHFRAEAPNFGDDLNHFLWDDLLPGHRKLAPEVTLFGVGTILTERFAPQGRALVVGSGVGYGPPPDVADTGRWDIRAVRGPKTAAALGLPPERGVCDPAVMLPTLARFAGIRKTGEVLFVPHFRTLPELDWARVARAAGVVHQSPSDECEAVIRRIAGARRVIAESMHAAIIADAFGVPWTPVEVGEKFNRFKWADWAESLSLELPTPRPFFRTARRLNGLRRRIGKALPSAAPPSSWLASLDRERLVAQAARDLARAAKAGPFLLSDRKILAAQKERLAGILEQIGRDYALSAPRPGGVAGAAEGAG